MAKTGKKGSGQGGGAAAAQGSKRVAKSAAPGGAASSVIVRNRRALRDYEVLEKLEAGLALLGPEVKSLRAGRVNMGDAFAHINRGELWLHNFHISAYEQAGASAPDPLRPRKLLARRAEIRRLDGKVSEKGFTLIPLTLYWKGGRAKVELGLCRGLRRYDKRRRIQEREAEREIARVSRRRQQQR